LLLNFTPRVGYFLLPGVLVEAGIDATYSKYQNGVMNWFSSVAESRRTALAASIGSRYYPLPDSRLSPFATAGVRYGWTGEKSTAKDPARMPVSEVNETAFSWQAGVGAAYFLSSRIAIEVEATYGHAAAPDLDLGFGPPVPNPEKDRLVSGRVGLRFFLPKL
jgi:opacity protein-like surface antigen